MTLGVLDAYHWDLTPGNYQEKYLPMLMTCLKSELAGIKLTTYHVAQNKFPTELDECDAYLITGSPKSAYDQEDWIVELLNFIKLCNKRKKKLIGICFGHQAIAQALGGQVEKSPKGWGVGIREFKIHRTPDFMDPKMTNCSLIFSHQDQVIELPPDANLLAADDFCPLQIYTIGEHIFSMQGHPEFTREYAQERLDSRINLVGDEKYKIASASLGLKNDAKTVWQWIKNFLVTGQVH